MFRLQYIGCKALASELEASGLEFRGSWLRIWSFSSFGASDVGARGTGEELSSRSRIQKPVLRLELFSR